MVGRGVEWDVVDGGGLHWGEEDADILMTMADVKK